jgi:hypothetical protein
VAAVVVVVVAAAAAVVVFYEMKFLGGKWQCPDMFYVL